MIFDQDAYVRQIQICRELENLTEENNFVAPQQLPDITRLEHRQVPIVLDIKVPVFDNSQPDCLGYVTLRDRFDWDLDKSPYLRPAQFVNCLLLLLNDAEGLLNDKEKLINSILDQIVTHIFKFSTRGDN